MSNTLRTYGTLASDKKGKDMDVTAFAGGMYGACVQFTINGQYSALAENQVRDLIRVLTKRVKCTENYQATSCSLNQLIRPCKVRGWIEEAKKH